ncbi:MAG: hypothetical protein PHR45_02660 [Muribaculaceae bacterium]|nr:hypothetical protein [Muribaculaceae bacterium]
MNVKKLLALVALLVGSLYSVAAVPAPTIDSYKFSNQADLLDISNNGKWAVASGNNSGNTTIYDYPYLMNLETKEVKYLLTDEETLAGNSAGAFDVSDDGVVAGCYNGKPAIYKDGAWKLLPVTGSNKTGIAKSITPDGRYIVGYSNALTVSVGMDFEEVPFYWVDEVFTEMPGMPTKDIQGNNVKMNRLDAVSPDGKLLLGTLSFSYPGQGCGSYLYDVTTQTYDHLGLGQMHKDYGFINNVVMSANGEWIGGTMLYFKIALR